MLQTGMAIRISKSLLALPLVLTGCADDKDEQVERGLALKAAYEDAYCAIASDTACAVDEDVCVFQPYESLEICETSVNVDFGNCPEIWEALAEREADVQACIDWLGTVSCGASGYCDEDGYSVLDDPICDVIGELQGLWCEGADTY